MADSAVRHATGYVHDQRYLLHVLDRQHPESPQRLSAINERLEQLGLWEQLVHLTPLEDAAEYIHLVHSQAHCRAIAAIPITGNVANLAVRGVLGAVKAVAEGEVDNAFCAIRPPGHHARSTGREEGFCFYNNVAIAARYAQRLGHAKVLIIDWDYHHGNGTQDAFYEDPTVLFCSTHALNAYPGTGSPDFQGSGPKHGLNINIPLAAGATEEDIEAAWRRFLFPKVKYFKPDFVLISAGFDSGKDDLLGTFAVSDKGFARLTALAMDIAAAYCKGRLVSVLEGGYNVRRLGDAVAAHVTALRGSA